ncbi:MAG: LOG family protein [Planctomycetota bacterium]|jgi:uncharacterized protein (TIGR00730 family)
MKSITVYCAASRRLDQAFHDVAEQVGAEIARRGLQLVYGGGSVGLMGEVARAARAAGARTVGIITHTLVTMEQADPDCDDMVVVDTMRERKRLLAERGDAFLVLPGGIGTYEEMFEVIVGRKLGEHDKPIGVVNSHGYFNPFVAMIEHGCEHGFIDEEMHELAFVHPEPVAVLDHLAGVQAVARGA